MKNNVIQLRKKGVTEAKFDAPASSFYTEEEERQAVLAVLTDASVPLTEDDILMVLAIRHERLVREAIETMILEGQITAARRTEIEIPDGATLSTDHFLLKSITDPQSQQEGGMR